MLWILTATVLAASPASAADFHTYTCSEITVLKNTKDDKKYVAEGSYRGGNARWLQDGESFSFDLADIDFDIASDFLSITALRGRSERDDQGREVKRAGSYRISSVKVRKVQSSDHTFETTIEHTGANDSIERNTIDGVLGEPILLIRRELAPGEGLTVIRQENPPSNTDIKVESSRRSCNTLVRTEEEAKKALSKTAWKGVLKFDALVKRVDEAKAAREACPAESDCLALERRLAEARKARDDGFFGAMDPKKFRAPLPPRPRPQPRPGNPGHTDPGYRDPGFGGDYRGYRPYPGTPYVDRWGRPVYRDVFGDYKEESGFPANPREIWDRDGKPVCESRERDVVPRRGC